MPSNTAAWIPAKRAKLKVKPAPYTPPGDNEIVVRNHAVAVNPVDWIIQVAGYLTFSWIKYPFVLGSDLAGEVVEVGKGVSRFKVGDRVLAHAVGAAPEVNKAAEGAFQTYTVALDHMAAPIPDALPYEAAAVLPLGLSTAACGLFQKDHLALQHPTLAPKPTGKAVLIWGGATSVGCNAIQLAVAAGYEVITTASPKNFDYVRSLGASQVFDYNSKTVVQDVIEALKGKTIAGALAIGATSPGACLDVVHKCKGKKFVSMASFPISFHRLSGGPFTTLQFFFLLAPRFLLATAALGVTARLRGIRTKAIFGSSLMLNEVSRVIYVDFLPKALATGAFVAAPKAEVVGEGLGAIQTAFDVQRRGMSAAKVVVALP
jgi:NADPH:quinone reductase-like Zn-dependent oxidoreductase